MQNSERESESPERPEAPAVIIDAAGYRAAVQAIAAAIPVGGRPAHQANPDWMAKRQKAIQREARNYAAAALEAYLSSGVSPKLLQMVIDFGTARRVLIQEAETEQARAEARTELKRALDELARVADHLAGSI